MSTLKKIVNEFVQEWKVGAKADFAKRAVAALSEQKQTRVKKVKSDNVGRLNTLAVTLSGLKKACMSVGHRDPDGHDNERRARLLYPNDPCWDEWKVASEDLNKLHKLQRRWCKEDGCKKQLALVPIIPVELQNLRLTLEQSKKRATTASAAATKKIMSRQDFEGK